MDTVPTEVSIAELREALDVLLGRLEAQSPSGIVVVERDGFWSASGIDDDIYGPPPEPTIGMVSESWENVRSMIGSGDVIGYGLIWVADVLRSIGKENPI